MILCLPNNSRIVRVRVGFGVLLARCLIDIQILVAQFYFIFPFLRFCFKKIIIIFVKSQVSKTYVSL